MDQPVGVSPDLATGPACQGPGRGSVVEMDVGQQNRSQVTQRIPDRFNIAFEGLRRARRPGVQQHEPAVAAGGHQKGRDQTPVALVVEIQSDCRRHDSPACAEQRISRLRYCV